MGKTVAWIGSIVFLVTLILTLGAVLLGTSNVDNLLRLTQMLLSWQVIGGMTALGFGVGFAESIDERLRGPREIT
jgi:hypothetical protein